MPVSCRQIDGKWRLVGPDGSIEKTAAGADRDGGGHGSEAKCLEQARAVNASVHASAMVFSSPDEPFSATKGTRKYRKELIHVGQFNTGRVRFAVDEALLLHWKRTFDQFAEHGIEVPVPVDHTNDPEKCRGKVVNMEVARNRNGLPALFGFVEFAEGAESLAATADVSVYVPPEFTDGEGRAYHRPIRHVALTNYPVIPGLDNFEAIAASLVNEGDDEMLKDLAKKLGIDLSDDTSDTDAGTKIVSTVKSLRDKISGLEKQVADLKKTPDKKEDKEPVKIAASLVNMAKDLRNTKLDRLVEQGRITPAVCDKLKLQFTSDDALQLSLASEDGKDDAFDNVFAALSLNEPLELGEKTGAQGGDVGELLKAEKNPLIADAERRAQEAS